MKYDYVSLTIQYSEHHNAYMDYLVDHIESHCAQAHRIGTEELLASLRNDSSSPQMGSQREETKRKSKNEQSAESHGLPGPSKKKRKGDKEGALKANHTTGADSSEGDAPKKKCNQCGLLVHSDTVSKWHHVTVHPPKDFTLECPVRGCGFSNPSTKQLKGHMKRRHADQPFSLFQFKNVLNKLVKDCFASKKAHISPPSKNKPTDDKATKNKSAENNEPKVPQNNEPKIHQNKPGENNEPVIGPNKLTENSEPNFDISSKQEIGRLPTQDLPRELLFLTCSLCAARVPNAVVNKIEHLKLKHRSHCTAISPNTWNFGNILLVDVMKKCFKGHFAENVANCCTVCQSVQNVSGGRITHARGHSNSLCQHCTYQSDNRFSYEVLQTHYAQQHNQFDATNLIEHLNNASIKAMKECFPAYSYNPRKCRAKAANDKSNVDKDKDDDAPHISLNLNNTTPNPIAASPMIVQNNSLMSNIKRSPQMFSPDCQKVVNSANPSPVVSPPVRSSFIPPSHSPTPTTPQQLQNPVSTAQPGPSSNSDEIQLLAVVRNSIDKGSVRVCRIEDCKCTCANKKNELDCHVWVKHVRKIDTPYMCPLNKCYYGAYNIAQICKHIQNIHGVDPTSYQALSNISPEEIAKFDWHFQACFGPPIHTVE